MRVWRRLLRIALACLTLCPLLAFAATPSDQAAAEHVLGTQWKHLARRAGMIFTGTVVSAGPRLAEAATQPGAQSKLCLGGDFVELRFRIDRPIAGVQPGQVLTIREWTGASSRQPTLRSGERVLLFLYPPSRLGLTSPVGGAQGQVRLDSTGQNVVEHAPSLSKSRSGRGQNSSSASHAPAILKLIPVAQLERAIRAARGE